MLHEIILVNNVKNIYRTFLSFILYLVFCCLSLGGCKKKWIPKNTISSGKHFLPQKSGFWKLFFSPPLTLFPEEESVVVRVEKRVSDLCRL